MHTQQISFHIQGMYCARCAVELQNHLDAVEGVFAAYVNYASEHALIVYNAASIDTQVLSDAITSAGYAVLPEDAGVLKQEQTVSKHFQAIRNGWVAHALEIFLHK